MAQQKVEHDFQTVDWCRSKHAVAQAEKVAIVLRKTLEHRGRVSIKEIQEWIGINNRNAALLVKQLIENGYLESNSVKPLSLKATNKAKQFFWVAV